MGDLYLSLPGLVDSIFQGMGVLGIGQGSGEFGRLLEPLLINYFWLRPGVGAAPDWLPTRGGSSWNLTCFGLVQY